MKRLAQSVDSKNFKKCDDCGYCGRNNQRHDWMENLPSKPDFSHSSMLRSALNMHTSVCHVTSFLNSFVGCRIENSACLFRRL